MNTSDYMILLAEMRVTYDDIIAYKTKNMKNFDDDFVISQLEEFGCATISDLKKKHNELAIILGRLDLLIE
jgi:hypothetical protein